MFKSIKDTYFFFIISILVLLVYIIFKTKIVIDVYILLEPTNVHLAIEDKMSICVFIISTSLVVILFIYLISNAIKLKNYEDKTR